MCDFKKQKLLKEHIRKRVCVFLPVLNSTVVSSSTPDGTAVLNTTRLGRAQGMQKQASPWGTRACLFYEKSANSSPVQMSYFTFSLVKTGVTNGSLYASGIGLVWKKGLPCLFAQEVTGVVSSPCLHQQRLRQHTLMQNEGRSSAVAQLFLFSD